MTEQSRETLRTTGLTKVEAAFAERRPPTEITDSKELSDVEFEEVRVSGGHRYSILPGGARKIYAVDAETGEVVGGVDPLGRGPVDPMPEDWAPPLPRWCG